MAEIHRGGSAGEAVARPIARTRIPAYEWTIPAVVIAMLALLGLAIAQFGGTLESGRVAKPTDRDRKLGPVVQLEPFTVSLSGSDRPALLRVKLVLELDDWSAIPSIKRHLAPVQFTASSILAEQTLGDIRTPEGKQLLRARLYESIKQAVPEGGVKAVYFRELLYE